MVKEMYYQKIHYLTLTPRSRSRKMLLSTFGIMWLMNQQSLMLLHPMVKEKMHLQENTLFDLDPKVKVTQKCCLVPSTSCDLCTSKVWYCYIPRLRRCIYKKIHHLTLTFGSRSHKMLPYAPTEFEVTTSKGFGGDAFTRKFNIWLEGQGHTKCCPVPSTSCDLFSYKVWSCYFLQFRRRYINKKIHYLTFDIIWPLT